MSGEPSTLERLYNHRDRVCDAPPIYMAARALPSSRRDNPGAAKATIVPPDMIELGDKVIPMKGPRLRQDPSSVASAENRLPPLPQVGLAKQSRVGRESTRSHDDNREHGRR